MIDTSMVRVRQHGACIADGARQALGRLGGMLAHAPCSSTSEPFPIDDGMKLGCEARPDPVCVIAPVCDHHRFRVKVAEQG